MRMDIHRLGVAAFRFKIVRMFHTRHDAYAFEEKCHRRLNVAAASEFYNRAIVTTTGFTTYGIPCSDATKLAISERAKGRKHTDETRERIAQTLREQMDRMTADERSQKFGNHGAANPFYGKSHPPEIIARIAEASRQHNVGENNPFYGKTHSDDVRKKLSENTKQHHAEHGHPRLGKTWRRVDCETCNKNISYPMYKRWHDNGKCKNR